jgi:hypothetical protein
MKPEDIVQTQLDAYNAKNIDALLATYAPDAEHFASGRGSVELLCVYEIANNCIIRASFASGPEQYE